MTEYAEAVEKKTPNLKRTNLEKSLGITLPNRRFVRARITGPEEGVGGVMSVRWEVVSTVGGTHVVSRAATPRTHIYDPACETWNQMIRTMLDRAICAYWDERISESPDALPPAEDGDESVGPYTRVLNSLSEAELALLRSPYWRSDRTWAQHLGYFYRICEELDRQLAGRRMEGNEVDIEILQATREALIAHIAKEKKAKCEQTATRTADKELRACDFCMVMLCETVNEQYGRVVLPAANLARVCMPGAAAVDYEQIKWIPIRVLCRLIDLCFKLISNGLVMGVALMLCLALRTSEACAVLIGELVRVKNGVTYRVRTQRAERDPTLKSRNAYRDLFSGKLLDDLIDARVAYLWKHGYSDEEIMAMHAVSMPGCPTQPASRDDLSEFARKMLFKAGYQPEDYIRAAQLMLIEPEYEADGKTPISSVAAYIFRRCAATLLLTVCDLFPGSSIADVYLGHTSHDPKKADYSNPSIVEKTLIPRMERLILHPDHSVNPLYSAIHIRTGIHDLSEYAAASFVAEEEADVTFILETTEPNQTIKLSTDAGIRPSCISRTQGKEEPPEYRAAHPIIPLPPSPEEFRVYLNGMEDVDISDLLPAGADASPISYQPEE